MKTNTPRFLVSKNWSKILIVLCLSVASLESSYGQSPGRMSYQAVIHDTNNELIVDREVGIRITVLQGGANGIPAYVETHVVRTDQNGLLSMEIGGGVVIEGDFSQIDWGNGPFFQKTEVDPEGGTSYSLSITSQYLSVPYALFSGHAKIHPPTVIIEAATEINSVFAKLNGRVNGNGFLTSIVFEWGPEGQFDFEVEATPNQVTGDQMHAIHTELNNLVDGTTYQYRIKASNAVDIVYSEIETFTAQNFIPDITTSVVTAIDTTSAISGGVITNDGGAPILGKGIVWSRQSLPTIEINEGIIQEGAGSDAFVSRMENLNRGDSYYVRAYAVNDVGIAYGNERRFITSSGILEPEPCTDGNQETCTCHTAPVMNSMGDLNGLQLKMSPYNHYTDGPHKTINTGFMCVDAGRPISSVSDNPTWLRFPAWCADFKIEICYSNCQLGIRCQSYGLQAAVFSECFGCMEEPCLGPSWHEESHDPPPFTYSVACATSPGWCVNNHCHTISLTGLEIDKMYYLLLDGCCGSACDVTISILEWCD